MIACVNNLGYLADDVFFTFCLEEGLLDILMMCGAYSTSRGSAITRVLWRFCWFTAASLAICYLYVYVLLLLKT
jgi:hypothetical protein